MYPESSGSGQRSGSFVVHFILAPFLSHVRKSPFSRGEFKGDLKTANSLKISLIPFSKGGAMQLDNVKLNKEIIREIIRHNSLLS